MLPLPFCELHIQNSFGQRVFLESSLSVHPFVAAIRSIHPFTPGSFDASECASQIYCGWQDMESVVRKRGSHVAYDRTNWLYAKQLEVRCQDVLCHARFLGPVPGSGRMLVAVKLTHHAQGFAGALDISVPPQSLMCVFANAEQMCA